MIRSFYGITLLVFLFLYSCCNTESILPEKDRYEVRYESDTLYTDLLYYETALPLLSVLKHKLVLTALFISVLIFLIICIIAKERLKKDKILSIYNAETKIAKKVHDEIANDIYNAICYAGNHDLSVPENKEKLIANLDTLYAKTRNISREINNIDTGLGYKSQLKSMLTEYRNTTVNVIIKDIDSINWQKVSHTKKIAAYRALQELMVNMMKHSNASVVIINFKQKRYRINISYSDNGRGIKKSGNNSKNGLLNVENRMVSINGKVIFEPSAGKGFHLTLTYPV